MGSTKKNDTAPRIRVVPPAPPGSVADEGAMAAEKPSVSGAKKKRGPAANGPEAIAFRPFAAELLDDLIRLDTDNIFMEPVTDDIAPGYSKIIDKPMDLTTLRKKLKKGRHSSASAFQNDVKLIWDNCMQYNGEDTEFFKLAVTMTRHSENLMAIMDRKEAEVVDAIIAKRKGHHSTEPEQSPHEEVAKRPRPKDDPSPQVKHQVPVPVRNKKPRPPPPTAKPVEIEKESPPPPSPEKTKKLETSDDPESPKSEVPAFGALPSADRIAVEFRQKKAANRAEVRNIRLCDPERKHLLGTPAAQVAAADEKERGLATLGQKYSKPPCRVTGKLWSNMGPETMRDVPPIKVRSQDDPRFKAATVLDKFAQASASSAKVLLEALSEQKPIPQCLLSHGLSKEVTKNQKLKDSNEWASVEKILAECIVEGSEEQNNTPVEKLDERLRNHGFSSVSERAKLIEENARLLRQLRVAAATSSANPTHDENVEVKLGNAACARLVKCASQISPALLIEPRDASDVASRFIQSSVEYKD